MGLHAKKPKKPTAGSGRERGDPGIFNDTGKAWRRWCRGELDRSDRVEWLIEELQPHSNYRTVLG